MRYWTRIPLRASADIYARAWFRLFYCAIGLVVGAVVVSLLADRGLVWRVLWFASLVVIAVPVVGAASDWWRLRRRSREGRTPRP